MSEPDSNCETDVEITVKQEKERWSVFDSGIRFDSYTTQEEAETIAARLRKCYATVARVRAIIESLSQEEQEMLRYVWPDAEDLITANASYPGK